MSQTADTEEAFLRAKNKIAQKLRAALQLKDIPEETFLPFGKAKDIILEQSLDDLTELCYSARDAGAENDQDPASIIDVIRRDKTNQTCLALAVLLSIDTFSLTHWTRFRDYLKKPSQGLPLEKDDAREAFGRPLGDKFFDEQFIFCPVVLQENTVNIYKGTRSKCKLPYLEQSKLGSGSFGVVYKIRMPQGHLRGQDKTAPLACKVFSIAEDGRKNFQTEWHTMQQILQRSHYNSNITTAFASLETDLKLSIFYPLAKCNLREYLDNVHGVSSSTCKRLGLGAEGYTTRRELFNQIRGLAEALQGLHSFDDFYGMPASCFHMDIKPENILVFPQQNGSELWKLTDFGVSRVEERKSHKLMNLDKLFNLRKDAPPRFTGPAGGGTFLAPEAMHLEAQVTSVCDVWSFTCVVILVMSFAHGGAVEARSFRNGLCKNNDGSDGSDWFFITEDPKKYSLPFKPRPRKAYKERNDAERRVLYIQNPRVAEQLDRLSSSVQNACKNFYRSLSAFLLENALVPDPDKRINASKFSKKFGKYFEQYLPAPEEQLSNLDERQDYYEPRDFLDVSIVHTVASSEHVAFVAPHEIYIYETLNPRGSLIELQSPSGGSWSCCALSGNLMCAAIDFPDSSSFECQLVSFEAKLPVILPLRMTCGPIRICAISSDRMFLAFVTKESKQGLSKFRVHLYEMHDLHRTGVSAGSSKLRQESSIVSGCAKAVRLQFSPDGRFLHAVFILIPGETCGAKSIIWQVDTGQPVDIRNISEPTGNDSAYNFVTTTRLLCSESSLKPTIVLLTQGRYLYVIDTSRSRTEDPQKLERFRRVIDFAIDESTKRIFCLAKVGASNNTRVFCSPYPVPHLEKWTDSTPDGARIPPDYDSSMDSFCFKPGSETADGKWTPPSIIITTVKESILTFKVSNQ